MHSIPELEATVAFVLWTMNSSAIMPSARFDYSQSGAKYGDNLTQKISFTVIFQAS